MLYPQKCCLKTLIKTDIFYLETANVQTRRVLHEGHSIIVGIDIVGEAGLKIRATVVTASCRVIDVPSGLE